MVPNFLPCVLLGLGLVGLASVASAETPIKTMAAAQGKFFGCAVDNSEISDPALAALAGTHCAVTVPGNAMKWDATEATQNTFTFTKAEAIMTFAASYNMSVRGHTLLWHNQLPSWVSGGTWTAATLTAVIQNHVTNVVTQFKGRVIAWDVVNEIFNEDGTFRTSVFYNVLGQDFVKIAFNAARAADPNAKLYINDYNIENPGAKATAMANLVSSLIAQGVPIDGIGSQSHLIVGSVSASNIKTQLQTFAALGVELTITELDIRTNTPASTATLAQQQTDYQNVFAACVAVSACKGVLTWGITDKYSWIPSTFSGQGEALPYDANFLPKPAYNGIAVALGATTISLTATPSPTPAVTLPSGSLAVYIGNGLESGWSDWSWMMTNSFFSTAGPAPVVGSYNLLATPQQDNAIASFKGSVFTGYNYVYFHVATANAIAAFRLEASTETASDGSQFASAEINLSQVCTGTLSATSWAACVVNLYTAFEQGHQYDRLDWHIQSGAVVYLNRVFLSNTAPTTSTSVTITPTATSTTRTTVSSTTVASTTSRSSTTTTTTTRSSTTTTAPTTTTTTRVSTTTASPTTTTTTTTRVSTTTTTTTRSSTTTTRSSTTTASATATASCGALYSQCGGINWTGPTCCVSSTCTYQNPYYSQCL